MAQPKLRSFRKERGITLEELGKAVGKSKQYMSALELGNVRLTYEMAVKIAEVLQTKPENIFLLN